MLRRLSFNRKLEGVLLQRGRKKRENNKGKEAEDEAG